MNNGHKYSETLETKRLYLKPVSIEDNCIYEEVLSSESLTKYLPKGRVYTLEEIKIHFDNRVKHWLEHGFGSYVIFEKANSDKAIGYVGVELCPNPMYCDIRYALSEEFQGKGYIFEASEKVLSATFELTKLDKIFGISLPDNHASVHLLKKLGMKTEIINPYDADELVCFSITQKP